MSTREILILIVFHKFEFSIATILERINFYYILMLLKHINFNRGQIPASPFNNIIIEEKKD